MTMIPTTPQMIPMIIPVSDEDSQPIVHDSLAAAYQALKSSLHVSLLAAVFNTAVVALAVV
jgi:hypothetical protein